ncbi:hypothetical protein OPIT5_29985 [Opitutaceae bacterium TAV5]|nr:hypothetical protein OPIT5_29985 [Opitutaceae bacterium TAV5]
MAKKLEPLGVSDPDSEWGSYVFLRPYDAATFLRSLRRADRLPAEKLTPDGHRAVMFSSTTDPYQVIYHPDAETRIALNTSRSGLMVQALEAIRDQSSLNVRILTRSPLVKKDFDLLKSFGNRLLLGMSLPTLRADLSALYEPGAPAPARRLETLKAAAEAGIPVFVAIAPVFPESDCDDLLQTMSAVKELNPFTVFHEPINIRGENVSRIAAYARSKNILFKEECFAPDEWPKYALRAFAEAEHAAKATGLYDRLHLWVDGALGTKEFRRQQANPENYSRWVDYWWSRISEWPGHEVRMLNSVSAPPNPFERPEDIQEEAA